MVCLLFITMLLLDKAKNMFSRLIYQKVPHIIKTYAFEMRFGSVADGKLIVMNSTGNNGSIPSCIISIQFLENRIGEFVLLLISDLKTK